MLPSEHHDFSMLAVAEFPPHTSLSFGSDVFEIKTCQRTLFLHTSLSRNHSLFKTATRLYQGSEAYEFLLRFSCGLESEIKGETDVFGQVKTAYKNLLEQNSSLADQWKPIFLKLFEDTKEIRAYYLQGIGGNTYGALARRLMNPTESDQILLIGAGSISKSVAPYFSEFSLTIWNRSPSRLQELEQELAKKGHQPEFETTEEKLSKLIHESTLILIATPFDSRIEKLVAQHRNAFSRILHLGAQRNQTLTLSFPCFSLSDLFEMEKEQDEFRQKQVRQAVQACHERALLRSLSRSIHLAHGWEDLAVFY